MINSVAHNSPRRFISTNRGITLARIQLHTRFKSSLSAEGNSQSSSSVKQKSLKSKRKTEKSVASLPKKLVLSGAVSDPLPVWDGGLEKRVQALRVEEEESASCQLRRSPKDIIEHNSDFKGKDEKAPKRQPSRDQVAAALIESQEGNEVTDPGHKLPVNIVVTRHGPRNQLAKEILENLTKFPHCILLTRVGQFYESYFDQAQEVSRLLSIKLTQRTWDGQRVWMCGFPLMHLDKHLKTLVQDHNRFVAMCQEFQRPRDPIDSVTTRPTFERRVVRVLTPGTLIDESFINPYQNNYLLAVNAIDVDLSATEVDVSPQQVGLAWIDVSTGEFFTRNTTIHAFKDHLARIAPREVVIDKLLESNPTHPLQNTLQEANSLVSYASVSVHGMPSGISDISEAVDDVVEKTTSVSSEIFTCAETSAISLLDSFLHANLLEHAPPSLRPTREGQRERMQIDAHTLRALEIRENIREGGMRGSLMSAVKRTVTSGGTRLLSRWLCSPSTSLEEINARQALVELFLSRSSLRADLVEYLKSVEDASRISQRFLLGKGDVDDLISVQNTIDVWDAVKSRVAFEKSFESKENAHQFRPGDWKEVDQLMARMADLRSLAQRIELAVESKEVHKKPCALGQAEDDEIEDLEDLSSSEAHSKIYSLPGKEARWTIKPQFSTELTSLHTHLNRLQSDKESLEKSFQQQYDAPSLTLRLSPSHGMHVHIGKPRRDAERLDKSHQFMHISESKSTRIFFNREWLTLGNSILETVKGIYSAEKDAFLTLRNEVNAQAIAIRRNARIIDELDVTSAFAKLASEMKYVRPIVTEGTEFCIEKGRHPTVELGLLQTGRMFTSNSVTMSDSSRLHVITGPNMGGKSTFLRQTALIAILAQTGSFVPANSAKIGIVDKVFSRIGANDDLFRDQSTFMVEMLETADILKNATERSLVIMDEVGRGTTVKDGLAISFATVHHLYSVNRCKALFATHFHEIVDMLGFVEASQSSELFPAIDFSCTDIDETQDERFTYSHRMRPGINRNSHGLKVARLAGMPSPATEIAREALDKIKSHQSSIGDSMMLRELGRQLVKPQLHPDRTATY
ncbi:muts domain V-domain-containing protein [Phellopilus nigrolimitatus]|nr:muts domain V-domain-containing protein [Phellopilus nigrolimitatus]